MSRAYLRADCGYRFTLLREVLLRSLSCVRWLALAALFQCSAPAFAAGDTERTEALTDVQSVDPVSQPQVGAVRSEWLTRTESSGGNRRWTLSRGTVEFGLSAGSIRRSERTSGNEFDDPKAALSPLPALSIGWRDVVGSRATEASSLLARAAPIQEETGAGIQRVGVEWKPSAERWTVARDGFAVRLLGNDRMTMRLRNGRLGIYAQRRF